MNRSFGIIMLFWVGFSSLYAMENPTKPWPALSSYGNAGVSVKAIFVSHDKKFALINGRVLSVGDKVSTYTVEKIKSDYVVLSKNGKATKVYVVQSTVKHGIGEQFKPILKKGVK